MKEISYSLRTKEFVLGEEVNEELKKCYDNFNELDQKIIDIQLEAGVPYNGAIADVDITGFSIKNAASIDLDNTLGAQLDNIEGRMQWNPTDNTFDIGLEGGDVTGQVFEDTLIRVRNMTGTTLLNGRAVYFNGRNGNRPTIDYAKGDSSATCKVMGILTQDIEDGDIGRINSTGYVRQIKTNYTGNGVWGTTWVAGDYLYVSKSDAGVLTNAEPAAPHHSDIVGTVGVVGAAGIGSILVSIDRHKTLSELSDIDGTPLETDGQFPVWHNTEQVFDFDHNIDDYVPYEGATRDLNLGAFALAATDDLIIKTGEYKTMFFQRPTYADEYPSHILPVPGSAAPDDVVHTVGGVARVFKGFDGNNTQEIMSGSFEIPHRFMVDVYSLGVGYGIELHIHWRPSTTGTGTVIWYCDLEYSPPNAAPIPMATMQVEINLATNKQYWHLLSSFGIIPQPATPFQLGGKIGFNLRRTPTTDSYGADALFEQIALHVPGDVMGSRYPFVR